MVAIKCQHNLESHTEFALRRIQYVRELYRTEGVIPTMAAFIKRGGLSKSQQTPLVIQYIEKSISELRETQ